MRMLTTIALTVATPGLALAHPGHLEAAEFGLRHVLTDPFHLGLTGVALLLAIAAARAVRRRAGVERSAR